MQGDTPQTTGQLPQGLPPEPFGRSETQRTVAYGTLRLQPVMLGPPPEPGATESVTPADDIDPVEYRDKPKTGLIAGVIAGLAVLATTGAAYWTLRPVEDAVVAVPAVPAPLPVPSLSAAPAPRLDPPSVTSPAAPPVDMARVDSDLVPPSTEGLTPARRISTIRIVVENDKEVAAPR
jgi:hypothetical protein